MKISLKDKILILEDSLEVLECTCQNKEPSIDECQLHKVVNFLTKTNKEAETLLVFFGLDENHNEES